MLPRPASLVPRRPSAGPRALNQRPGRGPLPANDGGSPTLPETTGTGTRVRAPVKRRRGDRPRAPRPRDGRGPQPLRRRRCRRETGAVTERGRAPRARTRQALSAVAGTCHRGTARARAGQGGCRVQRDPAHRASRLGGEWAGCWPRHPPGRARASPWTRSLRPPGHLGLLLLRACGRSQSAGPPHDLKLRSVFYVLKWKSEAAPPLLSSHLPPRRATRERAPGPRLRTPRRPQTRPEHAPGH